MGFYVQEVPGKGLGVFTREIIRKDEQIEMSPAIIIPSDQIKYIDETILSDYYIKWADKQAAIGLGYISLYNHSYNPNAQLLIYTPERAIFVIATRDIDKDEEILINYGNTHRYSFDRGDE